MAVLLVVELVVVRAVRMACTKADEKDGWTASPRAGATDVLKAAKLDSVLASTLG